MSLTVGPRGPRAGQFAGRWAKAQDVPGLVLVHWCAESGPGPWLQGPVRPRVHVGQPVAGPGPRGYQGWFPPPGGWSSVWWLAASLWGSRGWAFQDWCQQAGEWGQVLMLIS